MKDFSRGLLGLVLILIIIAMAILTFRNWPEQEPCSELDLINTSITVESGGHIMVGLNTDTDSLRFGKVSPEAAVRRQIQVEYDSAGEVSVEMLSSSPNFPRWTAINPGRFDVFPGEKKEVAFEVQVPSGTADSELTGMVRICFKEK